MYYINRIRDVARLTRVSGEKQQLRVFYVQISVRNTHKEHIKIAASLYFFCKFVQFASNLILFYIFGGLCRRRYRNHYKQQQNACSV